MGADVLRQGLAGQGGRLVIEKDQSMDRHAEIAVHERTSFGFGFDGPAFLPKQKEKHTVIYFVSVSICYYMCNRYVCQEKFFMNSHRGGIGIVWGKGFTKKG